MISNFKNFFTEQKEKGNRLIVPKNQDENFSFFNRNEPQSAIEAEIIEEKDRKLRIKNIEIKSQTSNFSYFLDGIERKKVCILNNIPVIYGYISAVIMSRTDKKMHSTQWEEFDENLYLPFKQKDDEPEFYFDLKDLKTFNKLPYNTGKKQDEVYPMFPADFEANAHSIVQDIRTRMEKELAENWVESCSDKGWLYVDGRLSTKGDKLYNSARAAGVIKHHHRPYLSIEDQFKVYNMKKGDRSSVFKVTGEYKRTEANDVFSWYLRIHNPSSSGAVDFGIIRIEIPAKEELLAKVDEISSWIMLETNPVAFPASRWDRMIYPIKYCEDYLKSKAPSYSMINSLFM